jgi:hypothetical protein
MANKPAPQRIGGKVVGTGAIADNSAVTVNQEQKDWDDYLKANPGERRTFDSTRMKKWKTDRDAAKPKGLTDIQMSGVQRK